MKQNTSFKKLDLKLRLEAIVRSALWGIAVGAMAAFAAATVCWFLEASLVWVAVITFLAATVVAGFLFYYLVFRPSVAGNAKRIDRYGLDERAITMVEFSDDDSYIAQKQREDAQDKIAKLQPDQIHIQVSRLVIKLASVFAGLFVLMSVVEGLSGAGIIPTGKEVWQMIFPPEPLPEYMVKYEASKGGIIVGEAEQSVQLGSDSEMVIAVANEGYMFLQWSDGEQEPYRIDENVKRNVSVYAIFLAMENFDDLGDDEDEPDDAPGEPDEQTGDPDEEPKGSDKYTEVNQIIDGQTFYRDVIENFYNEAKECLDGDDTIPERIRKIIEKYYSTIQ